MRICDAVGVVDSDRTARENSMLGGFCADCDGADRDDSPLVAGGKVDRRLMTLLMLLLLCLLSLSFCSLFVLDFLWMARRTVCKISPSITNKFLISCYFINS
jgi:hypothetical protein